MVRPCHDKWANNVGRDSRSYSIGQNSNSGADPAERSSPPAPDASEDCLGPTVYSQEGQVFRQRTRADVQDFHDGRGPLAAGYSVVALEDAINPHQPLSAPLHLKRPFVACPSELT